MFVWKRPKINEKEAGVAHLKKDIWVAKFDYDLFQTINYRIRSVQ